MYKTAKIQTALIAGSGIYVLLLTLDPVLSVPLREISSVLAYTFLKIVNVDIQLNGTILSTKEIVFDVVPACNGSGVLRAILVFGVVSALLFRQWSKRGFLACIAILVLLALGTNALRVVILISLGINSGAAVEGVAHDFIGLLTLLISLFVFLMIIKKMPSQVVWKLKPHVGSRFSLLLYGIIFLPFASSCVSAWRNSPLDRYAFLFMIASLAMVVYLWRRVPNVKTSGIVQPYYIMSQLLILSALFLDLNIIWSLASISLLLSILLDCRGLASLRKFLPSIIVLSLSLPISSYVINAFFVVFYPVNNALLSVWVTKCLILLVCLLISFKIADLDQLEESPKLSLKSHSRVLLWLALFLPVLISHQHVLTESPGYVIGEWVGERQEVPQYVKANFTGESLICRQYKKGDCTVNLMISQHSGSRHSMHNPSYCLVGDAWNIDKSSELNTVHGKVQFLETSKGEEEKFCLYWFSDGQYFYTSMYQVIKRDIFLRLTGRERHWQLTRVISSSKKDSQDFLFTFLGEKQVQHKLITSK